MYYSTKTYGHERGLSCCFRQWRATSHCNLLHGYALKVQIVFASPTLDQRNWVMDFGGLKVLETWLRLMFDHSLIAAEDDPHLNMLSKLADAGLCSLVVVPAVGCEKFAQIIFEKVADLLINDQARNDVCKDTTVFRVTVSEHDGNSASYHR